MKNKPKSWKAVRIQRRKDNFVGRAEHLRAFAENFEGETPKYMIFAITGEGGVGKTTLLEHVVNIASLPNNDAIVITCDDRHTMPAEVMGHVAVELAKLEITYKDFDERYKKYREMREEVESDPQAPRGVVGLLARGVTDLAIKSGRRIPGVGVFLEAADEKAAGDALAQGINYLFTRWGNKDEVMLLRETNTVLTPLFLQLLAKATEKRRVVLMFDVFERSGESLSPWLLSLFNFDYGEFDTNLSFAIAGRDPLEQHWTELAGNICHISLEPFEIDETRLYLNNREIYDDEIVKLIHSDTKGLPVLVELLASTKPQPGTPLPDVSEDAVKRFLQWVPQEDLRQVALLAAVPRQFNRDILTAALGHDATETFHWLSGQSFVRKNMERGYVYHEKVRELMLRHLHSTTPKDLDETHSRLADYFAKEQAALKLEAAAVYESDTWRKCESERVYHAISVQPDRNFNEAANAFLHSFRWRLEFAREIADICQQCAHENDLQTIRELSAVLSEIHESYVQDAYQTGIEQLGLLERQSSLTIISRCEIFARRGHLYTKVGKFGHGLSELSRAIEMDDKHVWALGKRGALYLIGGKFEEALADFNQVIRLDKRDATMLALRGLMYRVMDKYDKALLDFDQAIEINEKTILPYIIRGLNYLSIGKHEEAMADVNRAIDLEEQKDAFLFILRGIACLLIGKKEEAQLDFKRVIGIETDEASSSGWFPRIAAHWALSNNEAALDCLDKAIKLGKKKIEINMLNIMKYLILGDREKLMISVKLATEPDKSFWVPAIRGVTRFLNNNEEQIALFNQLVKSGEENELVISTQATMHINAGRYKDALATLNRLIAYNETNARAIKNRGLVYRFMGMYEEALADFDRVIALDKKDNGIFAYRGEIYRRLGRYAEAIADLSIAVDFDPEDSYALSRRAAAYVAIGNEPAAQSDIAKIKSLPLETVVDYYNRSIVMVLSREYTEAVKMLMCSFELDTEAYRYASTDDLLDPIRSLHEFQSLMKNHNLPVES